MPVTQTSRRSAALPPDERRAQIVAAVTPLVVEQGEAVTSREIAIAAGIAEGTIWRAFTDKEELLLAVLAAAIDPAPFEARILEVDPELDFETRLLEAAEILRERITEVWRLLSAVGPRLREQVQGGLSDSDAMTALFATTADSLAIAPREAARLFRNYLLAATHPAIAVEPMPTDRLVDLFLRGVQREAGQ